VTGAESFDLAGLKRELRAAGIEREIGLRAVEIGPGALERLSEWVGEVLARTDRAPPRVGRDGATVPSETSSTIPPRPRTGEGARGEGPRIALLDDGVPKYRAGKNVVEVAAGNLQDVTRVEHVVVGSSGGRVHADEKTLAVVTRRATGANCLVTVGSGTLTDIGKAVSARLGRIPQVVVQTALSVNGYADDQSVLLVDGVKRTTPTRWPDVLIADTGVLGEAPTALNAAGLGDLMAMFTAPADWLLANDLGMGDGYAPPVVEMVRRHGAALLDAGSALSAGDPEAVDFVARLLTLSGISMGVAGTTAPASGMEHTVSHLVEMAMNVRGMDAAFHGAQVGVCTVVAARLWEIVRGQLARGDRSLRFPDESVMERRVRAAFRSVDRSGAMGEECWRLYRTKLARWNGRRAALERLDWTEIDRRIGELLADPAVLSRSLTEAGGPVRFRDLDPPVDRDLARWALANCHLMRDRFTVADLAFFLGTWEVDDVDALLGEVI